MPRLPSLSALRTFEAAARHQSFTRAAEELNVTQAAVSHQIRTLEEELGAQLFNRLSRRVSLTDPGRALAEASTDAFRRIRAGMEAMRRAGQVGSIQLSVSPSLAVRWLMPRLERFRALDPAAEITVSAVDRMVDPVEEGVDLCIRYGTGRYPGMHTTRLLGDEVFPVCSPGYQRDQSLGNPADLSHHVLLHDEMMLDHPERPNWSTWLEMMEVGDVNPNAGYSFSHAALMLDAAAEGRGVALARSSLVLEDLKAGRLVQPFDGRFKSSFAYYIVVPRGSKLSPRTDSFRNWLIDQALETRRELRELLPGYAA